MGSTSTPHHPPPESTPIEALESSIQHLVDNSQRRQRWQLLLLLFGCSPTQGGEAQCNTTREAPWRSHLAELLESMPIHLTAILLILLDLAFTILDLSSSLPSCSYHDRNKESNKLYHWGGVAILSLLSARILALAVALGSSIFVHQGLIIDGLVVIGALALEVVAQRRGAGLLVLVSLWRVVRVGESMFELSSEAIEAKIEEVVSQLEELKCENRRMERFVAEKDGRIRQKEEELASVRTLV